MTNAKTYRGRIAPTPSGLLHIGHAQTFRIACQRAKERNGKIVLRIEDIDSARCKPEYINSAIEDLKSIGLDWDEGDDKGGEFAPYTQSMRLDYYWSLVEKLSDKKCIYPSSVSRAQIKSHGRNPAREFDFCEPEQIFPEALRSTSQRTSDVENAKKLNWRFAVPSGRVVKFVDNNFGEMEFVAGEDFGDFLVWRKSAEPSYELAVVADDVAMKITEVVRGKDLLLSTARQIFLYQALGFDIPEFYHCELLCGENGEKISKSSLLKSGDNRWLIRNSRK